MSNLRFVRNVGSPERKVVYRPNGCQAKAAAIAWGLFVFVLCGLIVATLIANIGAW